MTIIHPTFIQEVNTDEIFDLIKKCYCTNEYVPGLNRREDYIILSGTHFNTPAKSPFTHHLGIKFNKLLYNEVPIILHFRYDAKFPNHEMMVHFSVGSKEQVVVCALNFNTVKLRCVKTIKNQLIKTINKVNNFILSVYKQIDWERRLGLRDIKPIVPVIDQLRYKYDSQHVERVACHKELGKQRVGQVFNKLVSELKYVQGAKNRYQLISPKEYKNYIEDDKSFRNEDKLNFDLCKFKDDILNTELIIYVKNGVIRIHPIKINGNNVLEHSLVWQQLSDLYVLLNRNSHLRDNVAKILRLIDHADSLISD